MSRRWQPPFPDPRKSPKPKPSSPPNPRPPCEVCGAVSSSSSFGTGLRLCRACMFEVWKAYNGKVATNPECSRCEEREVRRRERRDRVRAGGIIYFLWMDGLIKVGWTSDLEKRLAQYPPSAELLATMYGTQAEERALHGLFNEYLARGREWFSPGPHLLEYIEQAVELYGPPTETSPLATPVTSREPGTLQVSARAARRRVYDGSAAVKRPGRRPLTP